MAEAVEGVRKYYDSRVMQVIMRHMDAGTEYYLRERLLKPILSLIRERLAASPLRPGVLVDVGTGPCWPLSILPDMLGEMFYGVGVDVSEKLIVPAREMLVPERLKHLLDFCVCDAFHMPFRDKASDVLTVFGLCEYVDQRGLMKLLLELKRICKDNCIVIYTLRSSKHLPALNKLARLLHRTRRTQTQIRVAKHTLEEAAHLTERLGFSVITGTTTLHMNLNLTWRIYRLLRRINMKLGYAFTKAVALIEKITARITPHQGYTIIIAATPSLSPQKPRAAQRSPPG